MSKLNNKNFPKPEEILKDVDKLMNILNELGDIGDTDNFDSDSFTEKVDKINKELGKKYDVDLDTEIEGCTPEE